MTTKHGSLAAMKAEKKNDVDALLVGARRVIDEEIAGLEAFRERLGPELAKAVDAIVACRGRLIVSGVGKSGQIAKKIGVPVLLFVANKVAAGIDPADVSKKIEDAFGYPVVGVLPLCEELLRLGSRSLFVTGQPRHPFTKELERISERVLPARVRAESPS